ncbi:MAG: YdcF family protein [Anaerolineales bacterium]
MQHRSRLRWLRKLIFWGLLLLLLVSAPRIYTTVAAQSKMTSVEAAPVTELGIVLAAETIHGQPSAVLRDRLDRGIELYFAGKVDKLVMSGRSPEPAIMQVYAVEKGVPAEDILLDKGGVRTYATCYNAIHQLGTAEAVVVTQAYHLPRTIFLCQALGLDVTGVAAHHGRYWPGSRVVWNIRETLATVLAFKEVYLSPPDTTEYTNLYLEGLEQ